MSSPEPLTPSQQRLITDHVQYVKKIAESEYKKAPHVRDFDRLESSGYIGLIEAASRWENHCETEKLDPDPKNFMRFARWRIRGAMVDDMRANDRWVSRAIRGRAKKIRAAGQDQGASASEMAQAVGITEKQVNKNIHDMSKRPVSLEAEDVDSTVAESTESSAVVSFLLDTFVAAVRNLDKISQTILALHYYQKVQLQEIDKILGIKTSKFHTEAVITIRQQLEDAIHGQGTDDESIF